MFSNLISIVHEWNETTDSRKKLQHTYLTATVVLVVAAGIIGLINYDLGQKILLAAFISLVVFVINAVVWALVQSLVLLRIDTEDVTTVRDNESQTSRPAAKSTRKRK